MSFTRSTNGRVSVYVTTEIDAGAMPVGENDRMAQEEQTSKALSARMEADAKAASAHAAEVNRSVASVAKALESVGQKVTAPGTARPDWMIAADLAGRLGADLGFQSLDDIAGEIDAWTPDGLLVHVAYPEGEGLVFAPDNRIGRGLDPWRLRQNPHAVIGRLSGAREGYLLDASSDAEASRVLLSIVRESRSRVSRRGSLQGDPAEGLEALIDEADLTPRQLPADQSNTAIVYGDRLFLKIYRRFEEGENPDVELVRAPLATFVGMWVPSLLLLGVYNKIVKVAGPDRVHKQGKAAYEKLAKEKKPVWDPGEDWSESEYGATAKDCDPQRLYWVKTGSAPTTCTGLPYIQYRSSSIDSTPCRFATADEDSV